MAPKVHTPVEGYTGTIAGVAFAGGSGVTDSRPALAYFQRKGYRIEPDEQSDAASTADGEAERVAETDDARPDGGESDEQSDRESDESEQSDAEQSDDGQAERPHPVQGSKAVWFEHLSKLNPDHGLDLETVTRKELIAAVEAIEAE